MCIFHGSASYPCLLLKISIFHNFYFFQTPKKLMKFTHILPHISPLGLTKSRYICWQSHISPGFAAFSSNFVIGICTFSSRANQMNDSTTTSLRNYFTSFIFYRDSLLSVAPSQAWWALSNVECTVFPWSSKRRHSQQQKKRPALRSPPTEMTKTSQTYITFWNGCNKFINSHHNSRFLNTIRCLAYLAYAN